MKNRIAIEILLLFLSLASLCLGLGLIVHHIRTKNSVINIAKSNAYARTKATTDELNTFINRLKKITVPLAPELEKQLSKKEIEAHLAKKPVEISGFGVAFQPAFSPTGERWAPYYHEKDGTEQLTTIDYDYTKAGTNWYYKPLTQGPCFTSPYLNNESENVLLEFGIPFYRQEPETGTHKPAGIVFANQTREHFNHVLAALFLGQAGYWFILAPDGTVLVHPNKQFVKKRLTITEIAKQTDNDALEQVGKQIAHGKAGFVTYNNEITGAPSWLYFEPLPAVNWTVCGVFDLSEIPLDPDSLKQDYIHISLALITFIFFLLAWYIIRKEHSTTMLWLISFCLSAALAGEIGIVWLLASRYPTYKENLRVVKSKVDLYTIIENLKEEKNYRTKK